MRTFTSFEFIGASPFYVLGRGNVLYRKDSTKKKNKQEGGKYMKKTYTAKQLSDAERLAQMLADIPTDKRNITVMMANSFMAGMEAQRAVDNAAKATA